MNRGYFIIACALLLAACTQEDTLILTDNHIQLEPGLYDAKAAQEWSLNGAAGTDRLLEFGVYAYYNGALMMGNSTAGAKVSRLDEMSEWLYNPRMYWPSSGGIDFYGYTPMGDGRTTGVGQDSDKWKRSFINSTTPPTIDFIVDGYPEFQIDLLLAVPQKNKTKVDDVVKMPLRHVLTKITFAARIDQLLQTIGAVVTIDTIQIKGVATHGKILMDADADWDLSSNPSLKNFTLERIPALISHKAELKDIALSTSYQNISTKEGILMMLPQQMDNTKTVSVTYTITKQGVNEIKKIDNIPLHIYSPNWGKGDAINYLILIKPEGLVLTVYGLPGSPTP